MELDRRGALLGLVATSAAIPLLINPARAQTQPASSLAGPANYVQQTLLIGSLAQKTSEIAAQKGTHPNVRQFAELEVAEQKAIASVLAATPDGKQPPPLPADRQKMVDDLNSMQAGPEFDQAYLQGQIDGHTELLQVQQSLSGEREPSVEAITARLAEQGVSSHLVMLDLIRLLLEAGAAQGENPDSSGGDQGGAGGGGAGGGAQDGAPAAGTPPAGNSG